MTRAAVLFLCTGNACRSQMAEGWARHLHGKRVDAVSAGMAPAGLDPRAVRVMAEVGVDIGGQQSKGLAELGKRRFELVVTVCDRAREACPVLPGARHLHAGFPDPPALARGAASEEEALDHYRRVRDAIRELVAGLPALLAAARGPGGQR